MCSRHEKRFFGEPIFVDLNTTTMTCPPFIWFLGIDLWKLNCGASVPQIKQDIGPSVIPDPPLAEQRRIAAKVNQLMALVDQLETQLETARTTATPHASKNS